MCKMLIMSGITDDTSEKAWEFVKEMSKQMSAPESPEKDGIGYAAIDNEGKLFGERWLNNKEAFQHKFPYGSEPDTDILKRFRILNRNKVYNSFGTLNNNIRSITLHSRASTNTSELKNNHPFVENFTSVIHNGMIYNEDDFHKKTSTCDSEVILHQYIKHNVMNKPGKFKKLASKFEGYYAMGIFSKTNQGTIILDIIKDNKARLEAFFIKELNTVVFATPRFQTSPVIDACKTLGFTIVSKYEVKDNKLQRLNAMTGDVLTYESFKPKEIPKATPVNTPSTSTYDSYDQNWNGSRVYNGLKNDPIYPYAHDVKSVEEESRSSFDEFFTKAQEKRESNVVSINSHSKVKHMEEVLERQIEEMLINDVEYTKEEVEAMMLKESEASVKKLEKFNDDSNIDWNMDERLAWHKKTLT